MLSRRPFAFHCNLSSKCTRDTGLYSFLCCFFWRGSSTLGGSQQRNSLSLILTTSVLDQSRKNSFSEDFFKVPFLTILGLGLVLTSSLFLSCMDLLMSLRFILSTWGLLLGFAYKKEPKLVGFYSSPHVLQQLVTPILFIKIMKR